MRIKGLAIAAFLVMLGACSQNGPEELSEAKQGHALEVAAQVGEATEEIATKNALEPETAQETVAVRIGHDGPEFDACGSYGQVKGLNPQGDNFLSVRAAPSVEGHELDRIGEGKGLSMCDYADGWVGIVYAGADQDDTDCGTGSPVTKVETYKGPCLSGWVSDRFVELIAG